MLPETEKLATELKEKYNVPVIPLNVENIADRDMYNILKEALYEFPVEEVVVNMPEWVAVLSPNHYLKKEYIKKIKESIMPINKLKDVDQIVKNFTNSDYISKAYLSDVDTSTGIVTLNLESPNNLYNEVLNNIIGVNINTKADLLYLFQDFSEAKQEYDQIKNALKMVKQTGYGVASPTLADMKLDKPEIIKQGARYGVKLKAKAPSIHIMCTKRKRLPLLDYVGMLTIKHMKLLTMLT